MYYEIPGGSLTIIPNGDGWDFNCWVPPVGWGKNIVTGQLENIGVWERSKKKSEQYWEPRPLPADYKQRRREEARRQQTDPDYYDPVLLDHERKEWQNRFCGCWFKNNGIDTYITQLHWFYISHWHIDIGLPNYRDPDREFFYALSYCIEDPFSFGLNDAEKRRGGKTYRGTCFLYEDISRNAECEGGIQSKTATDAQNVVFRKALISPFKKVVDYFRPIFDTSAGITPKSELSFRHTTTKGKRALENMDKPELNSSIDWASSETFAYDGRKKRRKFDDETGKCFGKDTLIRMYNGDVKKVQDINNGELVMGDDSTARKVFGVTRGKERMYRVVPKSGDAFECNESHILSLKWACRRWGNKRWKFGETVNISVREYMGLCPAAKQHLMLWRTGVEYPSVTHDLDPYFLGFWLGDGNKCDAGFTTAEQEVLDYMVDAAKQHNLSLVYRERYAYHMSSRMTKRGSNGIITILKQLNVLNNKHIPSNYLIDSFKNRLDLLAGLIDSDGHLGCRNGKPSSYEITQKNELLANQIQQLASSCGFKSTIIKKIATMVRKDGSVYKCAVFRVAIYGDLFKIPCKVKRKIAGNFAFHKNRRNPLRSGFRIEPIGEGDYYGFAVDGNSLFLLKDYTVVHNTKEIDIYERHQVTRYCLETDGKITGKALYATTVEDMDSGGEPYLRLWKASNAAKRDENGHTESGMYNFFIPAHKTLFFDKYGIPDQVKAREYFENRRRGLMHDPNALCAEIRKNPFTVAEMFIVDGETCMYNSMKLNEWRGTLSWNQDVVERGNFEWKDGVRDSSVVWTPNKYGRWEIVRGFNPDPKEVNNVEKRGNLFYPQNDYRFGSGVDPYDHDLTEDNRRSFGASIVKQKNNLNNHADPLIGAYICRYKFRPQTAALLYEDMIKQCFYFSCQILFESNKPGIMHYFRARGYGAFLMHLPGYKEPGIPATPENKQSGSELVEAQIENNCEKVFFIDVIDDWLAMDLKKMQKFDLGAASLWTEMACHNRLIRSEPDQLRHIDEYMPSRKIPGRHSTYAIEPIDG